MRRLSIRTRLALIYTALLAAALGLFGTGVFVVLSDQLRGSFDNSLAANAEHAAGAFSQDVDSDGVLRPTARLLDQFAATGGRIEILDAAGSLILDSAPPLTPPLDVPREEIAPNEGGHVVPAVSQGAAVRLLVEPIRSSGGVAGYVVWAASTAEIDTLLRTVAIVLLAGGTFLTILAFGVGWRLARRALAPVADVTETARAIALSGDFGARLDSTSSPGDEVGELAVAFNEMLSALEGNHKALQQFLGDASHQLRTPLTTLRAGLELLDRPTLPDDARQELLSDARSETERMTRLVADLLSLARAESGGQLAVAPVDLDELLLEAVRQTATAARHVRVAVGTLEPAVVLADRDRVKELLLIVLDNAARYTPAGGNITASLRADAALARIEIADTGIGIPEEDRERVFERLYRGTEARQIRPSGTGLGLAIAKWIADAHGGSIDVRTGDGGRGTTVIIQLPRTAAGSDSRAAARS